MTFNFYIDFWIKIYSKQILCGGIQIPPKELNSYTFDWSHPAKEWSQPAKDYSYLIGPYFFLFSKILLIKPFFRWESMWASVCPSLADDFKTDIIKYWTKPWRVFSSLWLHWHIIVEVARWVGEALFKIIRN